MHPTNHEFAERVKKEQIVFSDSALAELKLIFSAVSEIIDMAVTAFVENDVALAKRVEPLEEVIDDMVQYLHDRHIDRLKSGACKVTAGIVFIETLTYLERASDQCSSIAMLLLSRHYPEIKRNHHEYIKHLHEATEVSYASELKERTAQYLEPLRAIKYN